MKPIPLTARQIKIFDEIAADKRSAKETLEIALQYHANNSVRLSREEKVLWSELAEIHDLNINEIKYQLKYIDGNYCVVEAEDETD